jgi:hypothetical protein
MAKDDGIGGGGAGVEVTDDAEVEERFFPEPNTEVEEGEETVPKWMEGLDDETREWAEKKGIKDEAALVKSFREAERMGMSAKSELAEERRQREELEQFLASQQNGAGQQNGGQSADDKLLATVAQIGAAYDEGQITAADAEVLRAQAYREMVREENESAVSKATAPLAAQQQTDALERAVFEMSQRYADFEEVSQDVVSLLNTHPAFKDNPTFRDSAAGIEAAYGMVQSRREQDRAAEREKAQNAETLNVGGRGRQGMSAEEVIKRRIASAGTRPNDGF